MSGSSTAPAGTSLLPTQHGPVVMDTVLSCSITGASSLAELTIPTSAEMVLLLLSRIDCFTSFSSLDASTSSCLLQMFGRVLMEKTGVESSHTLRGLRDGNMPPASTMVSSTLSVAGEIRFSTTVSYFESLHFVSFRFVSFDF